MCAYDISYLDEVVETQGRLFENVQEYAPGIDTKDFIIRYMTSKTRHYIDKGQAFVCTMNDHDLWEYFCKTDGFRPQQGDEISGFAINWIGQFYAYFQWCYNLSSSEVISLVSVDFIRAAYHGLHDSELDLAVKKVGGQIGLS